MLVAMMAGWEFSVAVRAELGPSEIMVERGVWRCKMESISSRKGLQVLGKAFSQGVAMPTRWTPWPVTVLALGIAVVGNGENGPGKKSAVRGECGDLEVVDEHRKLARSLNDCNDRREGEEKAGHGGLRELLHGTPWSIDLLRACMVL